MNTGRSTLAAQALLVATALVAGPTSAQDPDLRRIPNSEFYGEPTTCRVTERFEIYDPHSLEELQKVKQMGFDQVILDRAPLHTLATQIGLDVVIANWWTPETEESVIQDSIALSKKVAPGRLRGISLMDEPERNTPDTPFEFYIDLYKRIKSETKSLQNTRLEISYWGPLSRWDDRYYREFAKLYQAADVMRLMPYPDLNEGPLREVYLMMRRSDRAMAMASVDIPKIVILQTWVLEPKNKLPTIDELRVMAYQAMLGGAETLSFFEYKPEVWDQTPGFEAKFEELMQELVGLRARLRGASITSTLHKSGILVSQLTWSNGQMATVRVNTNRISTEDLARLAVEDGSLEVDLPLPNEPAYGQQLANQTANAYPSCIRRIPSCCEVRGKGTRPNLLDRCNLRLFRRR